MRGVARRVARSAPRVVVLGPLGLLGLLGALAASPLLTLRAQSRVAAAPTFQAPLTDSATVPLQPVQPAAARAPWYAPLLSALLPGSGQALLGQQRSVGYAVAEGYLVVQILEARRDGQRERDAYRGIARDVARFTFGGGAAIGDWDYYERLQRFLESGAYSNGPPGVLIPESDPSTYNGSIWLLARETFWLDPDDPPPPDSDAYRRAIALYEQRAYRDSFRWSWRDAQLEQDLYRQTIDRSNQAFRRSRELAGMLLANHALSMVDAYVTVRLRRFAPAADGRSRVGVVGTLPF